MSLGLIKTSGIVTKTVRYGESSLIVTLLTRDFGKVSAIANNVRTKKSQMISGLQLFAYSEIVMYKAKSKKGLYSINEMTLNEGFSDLRCDLLKMAYASYLAEAANEATGEEAPEESILRLLLNALYALDRGLCSADKIKTVFEWRLAAEAGYAPYLEACERCHSELDGAYLSLASGTALCANCADGVAGTAKLSASMLRLVAYICTVDDKQLFSFEAGDRVIRYLGRVSEEYLKLQLDKELPTLSYLKKVQALENINEG